MKKLKLLRLIILANILFFCSCSIWAQANLKNDSTNLQKDFPKNESRSSLVFSGSFAHYQRSGKSVNVIGFYNYPVDPGFELLYQYQISSLFFLNVGLNYQFGRIANWEGEVDRFRYGEMSLPFVGKLKFSNNKKTGLFAIMGFSFGQMVYVDWESPAKGSGWDNVDKKYNDHYSNDNSFADIMLGMGISFPIFHQNEFAITPIFKYRVNDNWMGYARDNVYYEIKFSYHLNLIRNEKY